MSRYAQHNPAMSEKSTLRTFLQVCLQLSGPAQGIGARARRPGLAPRPQAAAIAAKR